MAMEPTNQMLEGTPQAHHALQLCMHCRTTKNGLFALYHTTNPQSGQTVTILDLTPSKQNYGLLFL